METDWNAQKVLRKNAKPGDRFFIGITNFGTEKLYLPVARVTKTQIVCSDGKRTERIMIASGMVVGRPHCHPAKHMGA